jgi:hypothetical protein
MGSLGRITLLAFSVACVNAQAEIMSLDDDAMGSVTGQAGISINIDELVATIGEIRYEDEGSLAVRGIRLGGANKLTYFGESWGAATHSGDTLDNIKMDIDVRADGDLVIFMKPNSVAGQAVDFSLTTDEWVLMDTGLSNETTLISNLSMTGLMLDVRARVDNQTQHTFIETTFGIDDLDVDVDFINLRVENMVVAGSTYIESLTTWGSVGIPDIGAEVDLELYAAGTLGLGLNINKFQMDVVMPEIYFGSNPSIGALWVNNIDITAQTVIYGH